MSKELDELLNSLLKEIPEREKKPEPKPQPPTQEAFRQAERIAQDVEQDKSWQIPPEPPKSEIPAPQHEPVVVPEPISHFTDVPSANPAIRMRDRLDETALPKPDVERKPTQIIEARPKTDPRKKKKRKPSGTTLEDVQRLIPDRPSGKTTPPLKRKTVPVTEKSSAASPAPDAHQEQVRSRAEMIREQLRKRAEEASETPVLPDPPPPPADIVLKEEDGNAAMLHSIREQVEKAFAEEKKQPEQPEKLPEKKVPEKNTMEKTSSFFRQQLSETEKMPSKPSLFSRFRQKKEKPEIKPEKKDEDTPTDWRTLVARPYGDGVREIVNLPDTAEDEDDLEDVFGSTAVKTEEKPEEAFDSAPEAEEEPEAEFDFTPEAEEEPEKAFDFAPETEDAFGFVANESEVASDAVAEAIDEPEEALYPDPETPPMPALTAESELPAPESDPELLEELPPPPMPDPETPPMPPQSFAEALREAFDETAEELAEIKAEPLPEQNETFRVHFLKRHSYFLAGIICFVLALVGLFTCIRWGFGKAQSFAGSASLKHTLEDVLYPVTVVDLPAFEAPGELEAGNLLSAALVDILMYDDLSGYPESFDVISIPAADVLTRAQRMFGTNFQPEFDTLHAAGESFYYDSTSGCYNVPSSPVIFSYSPEVTDIQRDGDVCTVTVLCHSDLAKWQERSENFEGGSEKTMQVTLVKNGDSYQITKIVNIQTGNGE